MANPALSRFSQALCLAVLWGLSMNSADAGQKEEPIVQPPLERKPVALSAADFQSRGISLRELSFDLTGTALCCSVFPAEGQIAMMGGPPGGPSGFGIEIVRAENEKKLPTLEALAKARYSSNAAFKLGKEFELEINGARVAALYWESKIGPWHDNQIGCMVPLEDGKSALYLQFSAYTEKEGKIVPARDQALVLKSLKWSAKP